MANIAVKILDRDYKLAVSEQGQDQLLRAVALVDEKMRAIRDAGRINGADRIAVMAALQFAHELLEGPEGAARPAPETSRRVRKVNEELEAEIRRQENLF
ncbi:MAG: cell division protein ZapA [Quisquiliibacterium sp.]